MQGNIKGKEDSAIRYKVTAKMIQRLERRKRPPAPPVPSFKVKFKRGPFIAILRYSEWYVLEGCPSRGCSEHCRTPVRRWLGHASKKSV